MTVSGQVGQMAGLWTVLDRWVSLTSTCSVTVLPGSVDRYVNWLISGQLLDRWVSLLYLFCKIILTGSVVFDWISGQVG